MTEFVHGREWHHEDVPENTLYSIHFVWRSECGFRGHYLLAGHQGVLSGSWRQLDLLGWLRQ